MKILGWIRYGDKAACGGVVVEGFPGFSSHGKPLAYYGAHMACRKACAIAEGHPRFTLPNGRQVPHHGHITTGGCPLLSTLNDVHGWTNERGETIAERFFQNAEGEWAGIKDPAPHDDPHDEQARLLAPSIEGVPYYIETTDGRTFPGRTEEGGLLPRIDTCGEDEYTVYWGDEALARMDGQKT